MTFYRHESPEPNTQIQAPPTLPLKHSGQANTDRPTQAEAGTDNPHRLL